jgi:hypothetical protein
LIDREQNVVSHVSSSFEWTRGVCQPCEDSCWPILRKQVPLSDSVRGHSTHLTEK